MLSVIVINFRKNKIRNSGIKLENEQITIKFRKQEQALSALKILKGKIIDLNWQLDPEKTVGQDDFFILASLDENNKQ